MIVQQTNRADVNKGQFYTLLSCVKSCDKVKLLNFDLSDILCNEHALAEMEQMKDKSNNSVLDWQHPLSILYGSKICLFNIRSWNAHIEHFLITCHSSLLSFTETDLNSRSLKNVIELKQGWSDIQKHSQHGLAISYYTEKAKVITQFETSNCIKLWPVLFKADNEYLLIVLLHCNGPLRTFTDNLQEELTLLPSQYRTVLLGVFDLNQLLEENINILKPILTEFNLCQRSTYATHVEGGKILSLTIEKVILFFGFNCHTVTILLF